MGAFKEVRVVGNAPAARIATLLLLPSSKPAADIATYSSPSVVLRFTDVPAKLSLLEVGI